MFAVNVLFICWFFSFLSVHFNGIVIIHFPSKKLFTLIIKKLYKNTDKKIQRRNFKQKKVNKIYDCKLFETQIYFLERKKALKKCKSGFDESVLMKNPLVGFISTNSNLILTLFTLITTKQKLGHPFFL